MVRQRLLWRSPAWRRRSWLRGEVSRFVGEQWVTFPRFVLSGAWYRNLTA